MKLIRWLFWNVVYVFRRFPTDVDAFVTMRQRCLWQRKFRPYVRHNDDGECWSVCLADDRSYTHTHEQMRCVPHFSEKTGRVVALTIYDSELLSMGDKT